MATSPFCSDAFTQRALKSDAPCQDTKRSACLRLKSPTEFPFRSLIVHTYVLWWLILHMSETLDCLRESTIPF